MELQGIETQAQVKAPGCFGAASVYALDGEVCKKCVAYEACGTQAQETLEAIRGKINVNDIIARHQKARIESRQAQSAPPESAAVASAAQPAPITAPVVRKTSVQKVHFEVSADQRDAIAKIGNCKTRELAVVLCKMNKVNSIRSSVVQGVNPFAESGPSFMRVACAALIDGGFTKASLKQRLVDELVWTDGTAGAHVAMACGFLEAFGVVVGKAGFFTVKPD